MHFCTKLLELLELRTVLHKARTNDRISLEQTDRHQSETKDNVATKNTGKLGQYMHTCNTTTGNSREGNTGSKTRKISQEERTEKQKRRCDTTLGEKN